MLNSFSFLSINREVNSRVSAEIVSLTGGTGSSKESGGNSESAKSANNGCCFSRSTLSLLTTTKGAR